MKVSQQDTRNLLQLHTQPLHKGHIESHPFAVTRRAKTDRSDHSEAHVTVLYSGFQHFCSVQPTKIVFWCILSGRLLCFLKSRCMVIVIEASFNQCLCLN